MANRSAILYDMQQLLNEIDNNNYVAKKLYDLCEKKLLISPKCKTIVEPTKKKEKLEVLGLESNICSRDPFSFVLTFLACIIKRISAIVVVLINPIMAFFGAPNTRTTSVQAFRGSSRKMLNPIIESYILHSCSQMLQVKHRKHKVFPSFLNKHDINEILEMNINVGDSCIETCYDKTEDTSCIDYNTNQSMFDEPVTDTFYYESHCHSKDINRKSSAYSYFKEEISERSSTVFDNSHISIQSIP